MLKQVKSTLVVVILLSEALAFDDTLSIAAFNVRVFGEKKMSKPEILSSLVKVRITTGTNKAHEV